MEALEKDVKEKENDAYITRPIEDLTINDALILIAVCASKEQTNPDDSQSDDAKRIIALAQDHPLFFDISDSIEPSVNKFMNMIEHTYTVKYVMAAAKTLKLGYKETAFSWAAMILMPDGVLTEERKNILDRYATVLNVDIKVAQKILVQVSEEL
jgi:hypothetical protein